MAEEFGAQSSWEKSKSLKGFCFKKLGAMEVPRKEMVATYMRVRSIMKKKEGGGSGKAHGNQRLSESQESGILAFVLSLSINKVPIKTGQVKRLVKDRFFPHEAWDGRKWWSSFAKRHRAIISVGRTLKTITGARICTDSILPETQHWCDEFANLIQTLKLLDTDVYNMDETLAKIDSGKGTDTVIVAAGAELSNFEFPRTSTQGCEVHFVCANGSKCPTFEIRKTGNARNGQMTFMETSSPTRANPSDTVYLQNATGMLNREAMGSIITHFSKWRRAFTSKDCVVLLDNAKCHLSEVAITEAWKNGVHFVFFPANCTHFLQPLDNMVFGTLKKTLHNEVALRAEEIANKTLTTDEAYLLAQEAANGVAFTKTIIEGAFKATGVWPFQRDLVIQRAQENRGTVPVKNKADAEVRQVAQELAQLHKANSQAKTCPANRRRKLSKSLMGKNPNRVFHAGLKVQENKATRAKAEVIKKKESEKRERKKKSNQVKANELKEVKGKLLAASKATKEMKKKILADAKSQSKIAKRLLTLEEIAEKDKKKCSVCWVSIYDDKSVWMQCSTCEYCACSKECKKGLDAHEKKGHPK